MPDGAPDVTPALAWLAAASPPVQIVALLLATCLLALLLFRLPELVKSLPSLANAIAVVRGRGVTEREEQLSKALTEVQGELRNVREELRAIQHWREEQLRLFEMLLPKAQCLLPDCKQGDFGEVLREIVETWRQPTGVGAVAHGAAD